MIQPDKIDLVKVTIPKMIEETDKIRLRLNKALVQLDQLIRIDSASQLAHIAYLYELLLDADRGAKVLNFYVTWLLEQESFYSQEISKLRNQPIQISRMVKVATERVLLPSLSSSISLGNIASAKNAIEASVVLVNKLKTALEIIQTA